MKEVQVRISRQARASVDLPDAPPVPPSISLCGWESQPMPDIRTTINRSDHPGRSSTETMKRRIRNRPQENACVAPALGPGCERRASAQLWADSEGFSRYPPSGFGVGGWRCPLQRQGGWVVAGARSHDRMLPIRFPVNQTIPTSKNGKIHHTSMISSVGDTGD